ncbi:MAG: hypothetical protein PHH37_15715 [Paludibacter sp.]|nr:hypothetical protein [Paludibacter sp.]
MKAINKIYLLGFTAVLLLFTACQEDVLRDASPEDTSDGAQAYFSESNKTSLSFSPSDPTTFSVEIGRRKTENAGVVKFTVEDEKGVFALDDSVSFEAGEKTKEIQVDFSAMTLGMTADLILKLNAEDATMYGASKISISVLRDYLWVDKGTVQFTENDFELGTVSVPIQMAKGTQLFRLKDLYNVLTKNDDDPIPVGYHLNFYLDTLNNWAATQFQTGFQDVGTGYEIYYATSGSLAGYCSFTSQDNVYSAEYIITPDRSALYLGAFSFVWDNGFPGEIPDPYEGDATVNVDWTMLSSEVSYLGYQNYSYYGEDEYGNTTPVFIDEYEIKLSNLTDNAVLNLLVADADGVGLPTGTFEIKNSNTGNTVRAGSKSGDPTGSYVTVSSVGATLYLTSGSVNIEKSDLGVYTISVDAMSFKGSDVKIAWTGSVTIIDKTATSPSGLREKDKIRKLKSGEKSKLNEQLIIR